MNNATCTSRTDWQDAGRNNYHGNGGSDTGSSETINNVVVEHNNGIFVTNIAVKIKHVTDGMSHTALYSEAVRGDGDNSTVELPGARFQIGGTKQAAAVTYTAWTNLNAATATGGNQFRCGWRSWGHGDSSTT